MNTMPVLKSTLLTASLFALCGFLPWRTADAAYPDLVLADQPVGYWRLNDSGELPPLQAAANLGAAGAAADGSYLNLVATGQPGALRAGSNTAASFPAPGYPGGGHVEVPWLAALNPEGPFTVEAWVKTAGPVAEHSCPLSSIDFSATSRAGWVFYQTPGGAWEFRIGGDGSAAYLATATGGTVTPGEWTHLAGVYDGAAITLYVNGTATATAPLAGTFAPNRSLPLGIGARLQPAGADQHLNAVIDEVAVYATALDAATLAARVANAADPAPAQTYDQLVLASSPQGYWRLGEGPLYATAANAGSLGAAGAGYFINEPQAGTEGVAPGDNAVAFNGTNSKIDIPFNPALNPNGPFTVELWAKAPDGGTTYRSPLSSRDDTPIGTTAGYLFYLNPSNMWQFWTGRGPGAWPNITGPSLIPDEWTHLVGIYDGARIYFIVNGVQAGSIDALTFRPNQARPLRLGAGVSERADGLYFWPGELDEVAFYGTALSHERILAHYRELQDAPEAMPPVIATHPAAPTGTVYVGSTLRLGVNASGTVPLSYQWTKNGQPIDGATSAVLTLANGQETDNGTYAVTVTNSEGSEESLSADVFFVPSDPPVIDVQPQDAAVLAGFKASFAVEASGAVALTYQWQKDGVNLDGATAPVHTIPAASAADAGAYRVIVTSAAGSTPSDSATLTLKPAPTDAYALAVLPDKPVAWWRLDETDVAEVAEDLVGTHHGAFTGGSPPTFGVEGPPGMTGTAYSFNGIDQKIDVPFSPALNLTTFTVECWARVLGGAGGYRSPVTSRDDAPQRGYIIYAANNNTWQFWTGTGLGWSIITGSGVEMEEWVHLVITVEGRTKEFYFNGESAGSVISDFRPNTARPLRIGAGASELAGLFWFNGDIDEVAFYDSVLSPERIAAHYAAGMEPGGGGEEPTLTITPDGAGNVTVTWSGGTLETSATLQAPWTPQPQATSPLTEPVSGVKFYRVRY